MRFLQCLLQDATRKVRGIRLRIPAGSGPVGIKLKPVPVRTASGSAAAAAGGGGARAGAQGAAEEVELEVVNIVENTVGAACVGQGLRAGCTLYAVQAQLVSEWRSEERLAKALGLLNEQLASNQQTELIFTPPREQEATPAGSSSTAAGAAAAAAAGAVGGLRCEKNAFSEPLLYQSD
jgi:hypothetical protein